MINARDSCPQPHQLEERHLMDWLTAVLPVNVAYLVCSKCCNLLQVPIDRRISYPLASNLYKVRHPVW